MTSVCKRNEEKMTKQKIREKEELEVRRGISASYRGGKQGLFKSLR